MLTVLLSLSERRLDAKRMFRSSKSAEAGSGEIMKANRGTNDVTRISLVTGNNGCRAPICDRWSNTHGIQETDTILKTP